ncbi:MAG: hypothetical protein JO316_21360 [Abitibacteriaceae bacterium]|nr:hypothetical protein [Abditibacteriaceae bacterium]
MNQQSYFGTDKASTPERTLATAYTAPKPWSSARPHTLVVACSDGRLQENVDEFLANHLGTIHYDRMYIPGGPGALIGNGVEFARPEQLRKECTFLMEAHQIEQLILLFHGASDDGLEAACCADYKRKFPHHNPAQINAQQEADVPELLRLFSWPHGLRIHIYRAEVLPDGSVRFVDLQQS